MQIRTERYRFEGGRGDQNTREEQNTYNVQYQIGRNPINFGGNQSIPSAIGRDVVSFGCNLKNPVDFEEGQRSPETLQ